jgi:hypothetical protein
MDINVQVAFGLHSEVKQSMDREMSQHVIEETDGSRDLVFAGSVQLKLDLYLRFICLA